MTEVSMKKMFQAGVHFGHQTRFWNPQMQEYIYGVRNNIHIIDLDKTLPKFVEALNFIRKTAAMGGKILFIGTKWSARQVIAEEAKRAGMPYVNYRWLGGMLTNFKTVRQSVKQLKSLEQMIADDSINLLTKKEALSKYRERDKLLNSIGGIRDMNNLPDAIFVIDVGAENIAVKEANILKIPVIGVVDTNNSPDGVDYVIPGNDDAIRSILLYSSLVADTIVEAKNNKNNSVTEERFVEVTDDQ